jgi:hypothetical protein
MQNIMQDFRYALRQLRKSPSFTLAAVLTLALGIGANLAVFSVMNAVLLNPSGIPHPDRVVAVRATYAMGDLKNIIFLRRISEMLFAGQIRLLLPPS